MEHPWARRDARVASFLLVLSGLGSLSGCGSSPPEPISPTVVATPTPTPRATVSLDAAADHFRYSPNLTQLSPSQSISVTFTLDRINTDPSAQFGYAVEFWFARVPDMNSADYATDGYAISLIQSRDTIWAVSTRTPGDGYKSTATQVQLSSGTQRTLRAVRGPDGSIGFYLDGVTILGLPMHRDPAFFFARVVGTGATFTYGQGATATSVGADPKAAEDCGPCVTR